MPKGIYNRGDGPVKDHLGNEFKSVSEMCRYHNIPNSTFKNRTGRGWTLEQALTVRHDNPRSKIKPKKHMWRDHLGNEYLTLPKLCAAWGINEKIYQSRLRICKWPLEKILTTPVNDIPSNAKKVADHLGNEYPSVSEMCRRYGVKLSRYKERIKAGWDVERALTEPARKINNTSPKRCRDHLGREYASKNQMYREYGVDKYTVMSRLERGWTLERSLTEPISISGKPVADYMGREFPTLKDMANFYGLAKYQLQGLKTNDMDGAIKKLVTNKFRDFEIEGASVKILSCVAWPYFKIINNNRECVAHIETLLDIYHNSHMFDPLPFDKIKSFIEIKRRLKFPYYEINIDGKDAIMKYWDMITLSAKENFGLRHKSKKEAVRNENRQG